MRQTYQSYFYYYFCFNNILSRSSPVETKKQKIDSLSHFQADPKRQQNSSHPRQIYTTPAT